jgi:hypothetical protein
MEHGNIQHLIYRAPAPPPARGNTQVFPLDQDFVAGIQETYADQIMLGVTDLTSFPTLEVDTTAALSGDLHIFLNGSPHSLALIDSTDLYEDGSEFAYRYALTQADIDGLSQNNVGGSYQESLIVDWSLSQFPLPPAFDQININFGDSSGDSSYFLAPEPTGLPLLFLTAVLARRRRNRLPRLFQ